MEDYSKTISTQATGFYGRKLKTHQNQSPKVQFTAAPKFQQQHDPSQNQSILTNLSVQALGLANQIEKLKQFNKKLYQDKSLEQNEQLNYLKYQQIYNLDKDTQNDIKAQIAAQTIKIQKETQQLFKNRVTHFKESDKNIKNLIQNLKEQKQKSFADVAKQSHTQFQQMKNSISKLKKQVLAYKKDNGLFKQNLFATLNTVRGKLLAKLNEEQLKRKSYDQIIQNLLQKSCAKAEQSLRRRLY